MRVDFDKPLMTLKGDEELKEGNPPLPGQDDTRTPVLLKTVAVGALLNTKQGENVPGQEQLRRWKLARRIDASNGDGVDLKSEEITLIKERLSFFYGPLVVGQAYEMIEPETGE